MLLLHAGTASIATSQPTTLQQQQHLQAVLL
jgi:hypothetical protein